MAEIRMHGLVELKKALSTLPDKLEKNILRGALRAGGKEFQTAARQAAPVKTGKLRDSIKVRTSAKRGRVKATIVAGDKNAFYAHMVEFGTAQHFIKPKDRKSLFFAGLAREVIDHPGAKPAPFMRPAFDGAGEAATQAFAEYVKARLTKAGVET
uniref:Phage protein, HK97 gp10 family n=1 Tax=biofilter metagenome TaxID=1070537 RepID=A0A193SD31_9ZZZZ